MQKSLSKKSLFNCINALTIGLLILAFHSHGSEPTKQTAADIIAKVVKAYGGEALVNADSIKVVDYNKGPWPGEEEDPNVPELWRISEELTIDYQNKRKSLLSYRVPRTTIDLEKWVQQGDTTIMFDILHEKYAVENWANFERLGASLVRSSDALQAKHIAGLVPELEYLGDEYYRGQMHQKLALSHESGEIYIYFIDKVSGLISKILRQHPRAGEMLYVFSNHKTTGQVSFARDMNFFVNGQLRLVSVHRNLLLNPELKEAFAGFEHFTPWGETFNYDGMVTKKLSDKVYQSGSGRSLTVFIEQDKFFIALGAASHLQENFDAVKKLSLLDKPMKYFVVTHHHNANVRGLENALSQGATLIIAQSHKDRILSHMNVAVAADRLLIVPTKAQFSIGDITLFDISTAHSKNYLMTYLSAEKMILADDHYVTDLVTEEPRVYHDMVRFGRALQELNLDVKTLVDIRGWRQFSIDDFTRLINGFVPKTCPQGFEICSNG